MSVPRVFEKRAWIRTFKKEAHMYFKPQNFEIFNLKMSQGKSPLYCRADFSYQLEPKLWILVHGMVVLSPGLALLEGLVVFYQAQRLLILLITISPMFNFFHWLKATWVTATFSNKIVSLTHIVITAEQSTIVKIINVAAYLSILQTNPIFCASSKQAFLCTNKFRTQYICYRICPDKKLSFRCIFEKFSAGYVKIWMELSESAF